MSSSHASTSATSSFVPRLINGHSHAFFDQLTAVRQCYREMVRRIKNKKTATDEERDIIESHLDFIQNFDYSVRQNSADFPPWALEARDLCLNAAITAFRGLVTLGCLDPTVPFPSFNFTKQGSRAKTVEQSNVHAIGLKVNLGFEATVVLKTAFYRWCTVGSRIDSKMIDALIRQVAPWIGIVVVRNSTPSFRPEPSKENSQKLETMPSKFPNNSSYAMASTTSLNPILSVCSSGCGHPSTKQKSNPSNLNIDPSCPANADRSMESGPRVDRGSTELEQALERERALIGNLDRLKDDYNNLRLRVDGEVHNLATANLFLEALNQVIATARKDLQLISNVAVRSLRGNLTRMEADIINHASLARVLGSAMSAAHYSVLHDDLSTIQNCFKAVGMAYDSLTTFLNQSFNSSRAVTGFVGEQDGIMTQILRYASKEVPGLENFLKSTP
ncbi:hypothetical protein K435DRAFT_805859 [Dendrothele bispora CBS 962.96]|uniref:Uncharacterized protein n=1 Tax=Dendrothele bispora (strain CBS 962.96) TaxID=1314807 RepID=A0A4S8L9T3_DENBC|nr:hypothetical protein K435DRAFT_805859 [Dendrothele bispora CBS 962.96]